MFGGIDSFFFVYSIYPGFSGLVYAEQYELTISCNFHLQSFPFDSHKCRIEFGDFWYATQKLNLKGTKIWVRGYPVITTEDDPLIINDLPYPYEFQLQSIPVFEIGYSGYNYSKTGALLTLERNSIGHLMVGYYYPTSAFALLSMISYLIDADIVRFLLHKTKICVLHFILNHFLSRFLVEWE